MFKTIIFQSSLLFVYSCQNTQTANIHTTQDPTTESDKPAFDTSQIKLSEVTTINKPEINYINDDILIPNSTYRDKENEIGEILSKSEWLELYKDQSGYYVSKPNYNLINEEEERKPLSPPTEKVVYDGIAEIEQAVQSMVLYLYRN